MRTTIDRLRVAVIVGAIVLVMVVAGFLGYARFRAHRLLQDLPARLGADIQKETNGFTYSQSLKGRTVFTIHAAKATQHKDGRTGLEDVGIVLYGKADGRADRIRGKNFEYDQKNGIVRAMGEVELDLQAPAPTTASERAAYAAGGGSRRHGEQGGGGEPIHVTTSGLVYVQRLGVASTDQPIRFEYRGLRGQARGAAYNSETGMTTLGSEVELRGIRNGRPMTLTAAHAEMDEPNHRLKLQSARYSAAAGGKDGEERQGVSATMLMAQMNGEGTLESVEGTGDVELVSATGTVRAPHAVMTMSDSGKPKTAHLTDGVVFATGTEGGRDKADDLRGRADEGTAHFDGEGQITTINLKDGVRARSESATKGSTQQMSGRAMELQFLNGAGGRRWMEQARIEGEAVLAMKVQASGARAAREEEARADVLVARWRQEGGVAELREMTGDGHTKVRRSGGGVEETSRGDRLEATFSSPGASGAGVMTPARGNFSSAVQQGSVVIDRIARRADGTTDAMHGTAEQASYDAGGTVLLQGGAELTEPGGLLRAQRIALTETSGDAEAVGAVQATYRAEGDPEKSKAIVGGKRLEAMHLTGQRATLRRTAGTATFYGSKETLARLWQGGSQVEAPVLIFGRKDRTLDATGSSNGGLAVRTVLARAEKTIGAAGTEGTAGAAAKRERQPQVLRVQSGQLHYVDGGKQAEFTGGVLLEDANGTMQSQMAAATLATRGEKTAGEPLGQAAPGAFFSSGVERVVAKGRVVIRQAARVATGEQAVYTSEDGMFVLTGNVGAPPRVEDEQNGSVTGAALRFKAGDNSVMVDGHANGGLPASGDGRVHLRTRVKQ